MKSILPLVLLILPLLSIGGFAQNIDARLVYLNEYRTAFAGPPYMGMNIYFHGVEEATKFIGVTEALAIDDSGRKMNANYREDFWRKPKSNNPGSIEVSMELPQRDAKKLVWVRGKVKIFTPPEEAPPRLSFDDLFSKIGIDLMEGYHKDVSLIVMDSISIKGFLKELQSMHQPEQNEKSTAETVLEEKIFGLASALQWERERSDFYSRLHLFIEDPKNLIFEVNFLNESGQRVFFESLSPTPFVRSFLFYEPFNDEWQVELTIIDEAHIQEYTFELKNIDLP